MKKTKFLFTLLPIASLAAIVPAVSCNKTTNLTYVWYSESQPKIKDASDEPVLNYFFTLEGDDYKVEDLKIEMISDYKDDFILTPFINGNLLTLEVKYVGETPTTEYGIFNFDIKISCSSWMNDNTITGLGFSWDWR